VSRADCDQRNVTKHAGFQGKNLASQDQLLPVQVNGLCTIRRPVFPEGSATSFPECFQRDSKVWSCPVLRWLAKLRSSCGLCSFLVLYSRIIFVAEWAYSKPNFRAFVCNLKQEKAFQRSKTVTKRETRHVLNRTATTGSLLFEARQDCVIINAAMAISKTTFTTTLLSLLGLIADGLTPISVEVPRRIWLYVHVERHHVFCVVFLISSRMFILPFLRTTSILHQPTCTTTGTPGSQANEKRQLAYLRSVPPSCSIPSVSTFFQI
jgi:hypothetical protein